MKLHSLLCVPMLLLAVTACSDSDRPDKEPPEDTTPPIVVPPETAKIVINEVSSSGSDSIEFLNLGDKAVDLTGWSYMDSKLDLPTAYVFPEGVILAPGAYLVVNKDEHHVGFGLGATDGVALYNDEQKLVDRTDWEDSAADVSWCRLPNGTGDFQACPRPTFGAENTDAAAVCGNDVAEEPAELCDGADLQGASCASHGYLEGTLSCQTDCLGYDTSQCSGRESTVVINEVTSSGDDNVEFFNHGSFSIDMSGWKMMDDNLEREDAYVFPEGSVLEPGAYLVLGNPADFSFGLGKADAVNLFGSEGALVDHASWASGEAETSWCRQPNGIGSFGSCAEASFGESND